MKYSKADIDNAREILTAWVKPGMTVYTSLKRVSASGMTRHIALYIVRNREVYNITYYVGALLGYTMNRETDGLVIQGCGQDMGFATVYSLSRMLFPKGFKCVGMRCRSNQHFNDANCRRETFKGKKHTGDGGYALDQRWL